MDSRRSQRRLRKTNDFLVCVQAVSDLVIPDFPWKRLRQSLQNMQWIIAHHITLSSMWFCLLAVPEHLVYVLCAVLIAQPCLLCWESIPIDGHKRLEKFCHDVHVIQNLCVFSARTRHPVQRENTAKMARMQRGQKHVKIVPLESMNLQQGQMPAPTVG